MFGVGARGDRNTRLTYLIEGRSRGGERGKTVLTFLRLVQSLKGRSAKVADEEPAVAQRWVKKQLAVSISLK